MKATLVALDGQPIEPVALESEIPLASAQRADVIVDVIDPAGGRLRLGGREDFLLATFPVRGTARATPLGLVPPLKSNPLDTKFSSANSVEVGLVMEGGAMRWLTTARLGENAGHHSDVTYRSGDISGRDLAQQGMFWSLNGVAGMPAEPLFSVPRGSTVQINYENRTAFEHAMHVHGHHVWDARDNAWRDTVLVGRGEADVPVRFVADNPGRWMLHCHMLEHQAAGMGTWFEVT